MPLEAGGTKSALEITDNKPHTQNQNRMKYPTYLRIVSLLAIPALLLPLNSCQTHTQDGALVGGLGGAAVGALISDDKGRGALIGGALGAAGGAAVGSSKDRRHNH
ncbi:MAG: hypothetical protein ACI8UO_003391 [Verrucomicrobiales bacterium]